eukprot:TRINITY_DN7982_c0_g1_i1.p1 TRINITY_DN7982_c0_g1~~TRINITY_DN7982_c0_g1_i1.p1  ORF type:complete len:308 (-),score=46.90 TRINITY_DN7982_c0_g1_i1:93-908(-)
MKRKRSSLAAALSSALFPYRQQHNHNVAPGAMDDHTSTQGEPITVGGDNHANTIQEPAATEPPRKRLKSTLDFITTVSDYFSVHSSEFVSDVDTLQPGDHIYTWRFVCAYKHHGIYAGNQEVYHFTGDSVLEARWQKTSLKEFLWTDGPLYKRVYADHLTEEVQDSALQQGEGDAAEGAGIENRDQQLLALPLRAVCNQQALQNAHTFVGAFQGEYDLLRFNCEHVATMCKTGAAHSTQVNKFVNSATRAVYHYVMGSSIAPVLLLFTYSS